MYFEPRHHPHRRSVSVNCEARIEVTPCPASSLPRRACDAAAYNFLFFHSHTTSLLTRGQSPHRRRALRSSLTTKRRPLAHLRSCLSQRPPFRRPRFAFGLTSTVAALSLSTTATLQKPTLNTHRCASPCYPTLTRLCPSVSRVDSLFPRRLTIPFTASPSLLSR